MKKHSTMHLGETIRIYRNENDSKVFHESQISDINESNDELLLSCPMIQTKYIIIPVGFKIRLEYIREYSGLYTFNGEVVEHVFEGELLLLKVKRTSEIKKIQIRKYFRLYDKWELKKSFEIGDEALEEDIYTINISAGGMKFYSNYEHSTNDVISLVMEDENFAIKLKGHVISIQKNNENKVEYEYIISLEFLDLGRFEKEHLIQKIFERQREIRNKENIREKGEFNIDTGYRFGVRHKRRKYKYAKLGTKARRV